MDETEREIRFTLPADVYELFEDISRFTGDRISQTIRKVTIEKYESIKSEKRQTPRRNSNVVTLKPVVVKTTEEENFYSNIMFGMYQQMENKIHENGDSEKIGFEENHVHFTNLQLFRWQHRDFTYINVMRCLNGVSGMQVGLLTNRQGWQVSIPQYLASQNAKAKAAWLKNDLKEILEGRPRKSYVEELEEKCPPTTH